MKDRRTQKAEMERERQGYTLIYRERDREIDRNVKVWEKNEKKMSL